jgi:hypothetical protein
MTPPSSLFASFLKPSNDVIKVKQVKATKYSSSLPITKWKKKYSHFLHSLYITYLYESKFTLAEYKNGYVMSFHEFSNNL